VRSSVAIYGATVAAVVVAGVARWVLDPLLGDQQPYATFFVAVIFATWIGGFRPALLATVLGFLLALYFFVPPRFSFFVESGPHFVSLALYFLVSFAIAAFGEARRASQPRLEELAREQEPSPRPTLPSSLILHPSKDVVVIGFGLILAVLVIGGALGYVNARRLIQNDRMVAQTYEVIGGLETLLSTLKDAETGQRGYLLTEDESYLKPYDDASRRVQAEVAHLEELTSNNPHQQARLALLEQKIDVKLHELKQTVALMKKGNRPVALKLVRTGTGKAHMDDLRRDVAAMQQAEQDLLRQRADESQASYRTTVLSVLLPAIIGIVLVGAVSYLSQRNARQRQRTADALRKLTAELSEADRRKDEFLATLAHELRNPLAPIRTGLQLMRLSAAETTTVEQARAMMERQLTQLVRLVDDLMDVSRISGGKLELRKEQVQLAAVVHNAIETSRPVIEEMGHELTVTLPKQPVVIEADLVRLAQVFSNLLTNAAKYSERGGHIWLTAERLGSDVVVSVKDAGIGIAADQLPRLFTMFSQVDRSLERSQGGLGIGLTLVKRLVEMHGGGIEARSEGLGQGSEFIVRFPAVVETSEPRKANEEQAPAVVKSSLRILIVDDNRDSADSLSMLLRMMGNDTCTAYDGLEALDATAAFRPDVILLDIGLPKLNGYETCHRLRERPGGKELVIIAQTGWGQDEDRQRTREAGFDHHLVKPVDPNVLIKLLAGLHVGK
jgi:signal transduction histidine kinase